MQQSHDGLVRIIAETRRFAEELGNPWKSIRLTIPHDGDSHE